MAKQYTCGNCVYYVDGLCFSDACYGDVFEYKSSEPACANFSLPTVLVNKPMIEDFAKTYKELRARFSRDVRCEECKWFCPYDNNPIMGICERTRFEFDYYGKACACRKFELKDVAVT